MLNNSLTMVLEYDEKDHHYRESPVSVSIAEGGFDLKAARHECRHLDVCDLCVDLDSDKQDERGQD